MSLEVNITKKLDGFTLHANFAARSTATAILGASGCGKSMTLRCIAGIVKPDAGRIVLDGRVLFDSAQHIDLPPQQRGVGLLFQNYALFPNMTVEQNVLCGLKAEKDKAARKARCAEMLQAMRLESLAKRYPAQLSGGQQQRTALARILVGRPKILMLDEPFSALDSYLREEVESEVGSLLAGFGGTALLVTHNRDEAYRLCRDMIVMDGGQVLRTGGTKEVFADPQSTTAARLTGCKNILSCTRVDAHTVRLTGWDAPLHLAAEVPETCTAVGIRAHDFAPCAPAAPNALPVQLNSTSENPFDWNLIFTAPDGTAALTQLSGGAFDLVILDLMMPFMDGMTCLREMRARHINTPVIILTARGEEYDKLAGLEGGADDYVVKPFSPRELVARVKAVLNRTMPKPAAASDTMTFGELTIDTASHTVRVSGEEVALTPKEFDLLVFLASNKGIALSREKILQKVWNYDYFGEDRTVDTHVKMLRGHLGKCRSYIATVWGIGYKFDPDATR